MTGSNSTWTQQLEAAFAMIPRAGMRGSARWLADASGRPLETCRTAIRRYLPGKQPRRLHQKCKRCARIRAILAESDRQQTP